MIKEKLLFEYSLTDNNPGKNATLYLFYHIEDKLYFFRVIDPTIKFGQATSDTFKIPSDEMSGEAMSILGSLLAYSEEYAKQINKIIHEINGILKSENNMEEPKKETFSFFEGGITITEPTRSINIIEFLEMLKSKNKSEEEIKLLEKIRNEPIKEKRYKLKSKLNYATFGGRFDYRDIEGFKKSSGLASFDVDDIGSNLEEIKAILINDKYTHSIFKSPSGNGLKFIVRIPEIKSNEEYKQHFYSIIKHYNLLKIDKKSKNVSDVSRACYIGLDENPYYNPDSETYTDKIEEGQEQEPITKRTANTSKDESRSGLEYRKILALLGQGKSREEIYGIMEAYSKWASSPEQYRTLTFEKAENFYLGEKEKSSPKPQQNITPLKRIDVVPNATITTKILVSDISPGVNLLKGYVVSCEKCGAGKVVFTKKYSKCKELANDEDSHFQGCKYITMNGQQADQPLTYESINDTGYYCGAYDPEDTGSAQQFSAVFFSNKIIPSDKNKREEFETDMQVKPIIITGKIIPLPSTKKVTEWCIDVTSFSFEEYKIFIKEDILHKFGDVKRDNPFFQDNFAPEVYEKNLDKKIYAINLLSPVKIKLPNGKEEYAVQSILSAGDPGQSKTNLFKATLKYCIGIRNAKLISVENSTNRGLIGAVVKNPTTGQFMVKIGQLTLCNYGYVGLDGFGKLTQDDSAQLRGIQEEKVLQIHKAGNLQKECAVRIHAMANLKEYLKSYPTKHQASFDISATTLDDSGKFSGADRRRYSHVSILADDDTKAEEINQHMYVDYNNSKEKELEEYWNNLRALAWGIGSNGYELIWEEGIMPEALFLVNKLGEQYKNFSLDYGVLSKGGFKQFITQLPGIAILHESIKDKNIIIKREHAQWLYNLYLEEFRELGLDIELEVNQYYEIYADYILGNADPELIKILNLIWQYGSQSAVEKAGKGSRPTIWKKFREIIPYKVMFNDSLAEEQKYYCPAYGSGSAEIRGSKKNQYYVWLGADGELPQVIKGNGSLTDFGKILLRKTKVTGKRKLLGANTVITENRGENHIGVNTPPITIKDINKGYQNKQSNDIHSVNSVNSDKNIVFLPKTDGFLPPQKSSDNDEDNSKTRLKIKLPTEEDLKNAGYIK